jgi:hypothetical protein
MWFEAAHVDEEGLVIPGSPGRKCASARLTADALVLEKATAKAALTWDEYPSNWYIASFPRGPTRLWTRSFSDQISTYPAVGAAIYTRNSCAERVTPVLIAVAISRFRLPKVDPVKHVFERGPVIPLHKPRSNISNIYRHDATFGFLCRLLHERRDLRPGLADHRRCEQLRRDILSKPMNPIPPHFGMRTTSIEIRNAIKGLNLIHHFGGRPIPGEELMDIETAVPLVMGTLAASMSGNHHIGENEVREVLENDYYSVDPWPFAALFI